VVCGRGDSSRRAAAWLEELRFGAALGSKVAEQKLAQRRGDPFGSDLRGGEEGELRCQHQKEPQ
jgi:hypothetical protein